MPRYGVLLRQRDTAVATNGGPDNAGLVAPLTSARLSESAATQPEPAALTEGVSGSAAKPTPIGCRLS